MFGHFNLVLISNYLWIELKWMEGLCSICWTKFKDRVNLPTTAADGFKYHISIYFAVYTIKYVLCSALASSDSIRFLSLTEIIEYVYMDSRFIMIKTLLRLRICHVNSYFFDYLNPAEVIHEIELRHVEYSFFSRIIEVQCRRVHTSITLLASCRTFSTHFATGHTGQWSTV